MTATLAIAGFEFRSRLKLISTWVYFLVFLSLAMLWIAAAGGVFKEANISFGSGKVFVNSPYALSQTLCVLGMLGVSVMAAMMGRAVQQDHEHRTHAFFFTTPTSQTAYLAGRFLGALAVLALVFAGLGLGAWLATFLPGLDAERLGPNRLQAYLRPYLLVLGPNLLLVGSVFFTLAALTRRMLPVYVGSVVVLIGWLVAQQLVRNLDNKMLAALIDPFGSRALAVLTQYWTVAERNSLDIALEGPLLWNRMLWLSVAAIVAVVCAWRFSFARFASDGATRRETADPAGPEPVAAGPAVPARQDTTRTWRLLPRLAWLQFRESVRNVYFGVLVLAGILFLGAASTTMGELFGTGTWPHTFQVVELLSGSFTLFMLVIIAFYGGELVWREREARFDPIADALPVPTWLPLGAKLLALMAIPLLLQVVLMLCGIAIQLGQGFTKLDLPVYAQALFGNDLVNLWLLCALAIAVHSVVNHKYVGHFLMVVYYLFLVFSGALGLEHHLLKYGSVPEATYSDMNGWGHYLPRERALQATWTAAAVLLVWGAYLFWQRGSAAGWRERRRQAAQRLTTPAIAVAGVALLAFAACAGWVLHNTHGLNRHETAHDGQQRQADYEKRYKALLTSQPQPKITAVTLDVALFPERQGVRVKGRFDLQNRQPVPVGTLNLNFLLGERLTVHRMATGVPSHVVEDDGRIGVRRLQFETPLAPGATTTLDFDVEVVTRGFTNRGSNTQVVANGSFLPANLVLPLIGYQRHAELERDQDRRSFGLPPRERLPDRDDAQALQVNPLASDADWIAFEATVSTVADQVAIAPGYLQKTWQSEDGRRHFHYRMDVPVLHFYAFQSARYAVRRDRWNDVAIEIHHQPGHEYNLDAMVASTKAALDYNSRHFGPYQYRQFRIVEFPRYARFAQAFPNTVPYSEEIGFIARVQPDDPKDLDYPYYVTAHEAAHQWWGHQVIAADVQGGTMLIETLSQYSALMVMKQRFGPAKMRRFLRHELDRYLVGRGHEQKKEVPLARVENQPYIHYSKGSLAMYLLADYLGEERVNGVIRAWRDRHAFKGPPYPNATGLVAALREAAPPELKYLVDDLFERIVLYDNRAVSAQARPLAGGRFEVTVQVTARKLEADALGHEKPMALADLIDVGAIDENGDAIVLQRQRFDREAGTYTFVADRRPAKAGIDPLNKLIDRRPEDNVVGVE